MTELPDLDNYSGVIPDKASQSKDEFADAINPYLNFWNVTAVPQLQDWGTKLRTLATEISDFATSAESSKTSAEEARDVALGAANYKGDWDSGTTYGLGESVTYNGSIMYSKIADNTTEPTAKTTTAEWFYKPSGANYTDVKDADYDAVSGDFIYCDTVANGAFTITLPASPSVNDVISFLDIKAGFEDNNLTIARNGNNIMSLDEDMVVDKNNASLGLIFIDSNWRIK